jgi:hypothetical protein
VLPAIWLDVGDDGSGSYWDDSGWLGYVMLILTLVSAGLLALAVSGRSGQAGQRYLLPALVLAGLFGFVPLQAAFNKLGDLGAGGWLGALGALALAIGALAALARGPGRTKRRLALQPGPQGPQLLSAARAPQQLLPESATLVGALLAFIALWLSPLEFSNETYWSLNNAAFGHSLGVTMLLLILVTAGLIVLSELGPGRFGDCLFVVPSLVLGGIFLFYPLILMSEDLNYLDAGGWLGVVATGFFVVGALAAFWRAAAERRPAPPTV